MKKYILLVMLSVITLNLSAQTDVFRIAPGAENRIMDLLDKPELVKPAAATPLGKTWFRLEADIHVFTDKVNAKQAAEVLRDIDNFSIFYDGKKSKLSAKIVSGRPDDGIVDFISTVIIPVINVKLNSPYRASVKTVTYNDTKFMQDIKQIASDNDTNKKIKNLSAPRYIEEITFNGKKYTYIRMYSIMDIDASIISGPTLEKNTGPTNGEAVLATIEAAKNKK